jgi:hypothetical protein
MAMEKLSCWGRLLSKSMLTPDTAGLSRYCRVRRRDLSARRTNPLVARKIVAGSGTPTTGGSVNSESMNPSTVR